ncbi:hypothetical protein PPBDW_II0498 [Photobacterium kishitanii]|nr:hypothetical protein PPBDW_II0498 [Photobacterium kishitanii]
MKAKKSVNSLLSLFEKKSYAIDFIVWGRSYIAVILVGLVVVI